MTALLRRLVLPALIGAVTGVGVGILAGAFEDRGLQALSAAPGLAAAWVSPLALLLTFAVVNAFSLRGQPSGSELYIQTYHRPEAHIAPGDVPGRILAAITTVGLGGSQGFEAASALLGSSLGDLIGRVRRLAIDPDDGRSLMAAGASAGIAAVFSSPAVGLLYGLEVPYRRDVDAPRLVPAAVASACAYATRVAVAGAHPLIEVKQLPGADVAFVAGCLLVGVACGFAGRLFAEAQTRLQHLARRGTAWVRVAGASLALGGLAWAGHELSGSWITLGPGHIATAWLVSGDHAAWLVAVLLLIRTAGTLVCVYGGGGGGVFTALACTGAYIGMLVSYGLGHQDTLAFPFIGAATFLAAGYRIPLCCMLWVGEASGDLVLTLGGALAIAVGQALVGEASVSEAKRDRR